MITVLRIKDTPRAQALGVVGRYYRNGMALIPLFGMCEREIPVDLTADDLEEIIFI
jgi:hypothetical protein